MSDTELALAFKRGHVGISLFAPDLVATVRAQGWVPLSEFNEAVGMVNLGDYPSDLEGLKQVIRDSVEAKAARDEASARIAKALEVHVAHGYWKLDANGEAYDKDPENDPFDGYICLTCSDTGTEDAMDEWEMDLTESGVVEYPCETVRALTTSSDARPGGES